MKYTIDPGRNEKVITVIDNIVYSHVTDTEGNPLDLKMSVTASFGNSELMALRGRKVPEGTEGSKLPCVIWFNGGGWRGADKNMQLADLMYIARSGYVLACAYYRSSAQGHFPDQLIDALTAVRFLKANAVKFGIDPERIAVMGRSAGGQLASLVGTNMGRYVSGEYSDYSSDVKAVIDMFGPVDLVSMAEEHLEQERLGTLQRWSKFEETHEGAVLGGERSDVLERAAEFSPYRNITEKCADHLILHGLEDNLVPYQMSEKYYEALTEQGIPADLVLIEHAGHGTPEFFQKETGDIIIGWLKQHL